MTNKYIVPFLPYTSRNLFFTVKEIQPLSHSQTIARIYIPLNSAFAIQTLCRAIQSIVYYMKRSSGPVQVKGYYRANIYEHEEKKGASVGEEGRLVEACPGRRK